MNETVDIKGYGLDPYNRILGVIILTGKDINLEMIRSGMAEVYKGKPPHGLDMYPYQKAEYEAKTNKRGIWSIGDKYISPKEWRKMKRDK